MDHPYLATIPPPQPIHDAPHSDDHHWTLAAAKCHLMELIPASKGSDRHNKKRAGPTGRSCPWVGVSQHKGTDRWEAHIWDGKGAYNCGKQLHLGSFDSAKTAARTYDRAAIYLRGQEAHLNFPPSDYLTDDEPLLSIIFLPKDDFISTLRAISQEPRAKPSKVALSRKRLKQTSDTGAPQANNMQADVEVLDGSPRSLEAIAQPQEMQPDLDALGALSPGFLQHVDSQDKTPQPRSQAADFSQPPSPPLLPAPSPLLIGPESPWGFSSPLGLSPFATPPRRQSMMAPLGATAGRVELPTAVLPSKVIVRHVLPSKILVARPVRPDAYHDVLCRSREIYRGVPELPHEKLSREGGGCLGSASCSQTWRQQTTAATDDSSQSHGAGALRPIPRQVNASRKLYFPLSANTEHLPLASGAPDCPLCTSQPAASMSPDGSSRIHDSLQQSLENIFGPRSAMTSIGSLQSATKSRHNQSMQRSLINFLSASNSRQTSRHHQATCHQSQATTPPRQSGDQQMCQQPNAALYSPPAQDPGKLSSPEISGPVAQDPSGRCSADQGSTAPMPGGPATTFAPPGA